MFIGSPTTTNGSLPAPQSPIGDHSLREVRAIEQKLARAGFNPGDKDGIANTRTIAAIKAFQDAVGGLFFGQMIKALRSGVGKPAYLHGGQAEKRPRLLGCAVDIDRDIKSASPCAGSG